MKPGLEVLLSWTVGCDTLAWVKSVLLSSTVAWVSPDKLGH